MRLGVYVLALAAATLIFPSAQAQGPAKARPAPPEKSSPIGSPSWEREPTKVFGVALGAPLPTTEFPSCVEPARENNYAQPDAPCIQPPQTSYSIAKLRGLKLTGVADEASLFLTEGQVGSIHVYLRQRDFNTMKGILIERYGAPTKTETQAVTTRGGANLTSQIISWEGKENSLTLIERLGQVDQSVAAFTNLRLQAIEQAKRASTTTENAKKF